MKSKFGGKNLAEVEDKPKPFATPSARIGAMQRSNTTDLGQRYKNFSGALEAKRVRTEQELMLDEIHRRRMIEELKKSFKFSGILCPLRGFLELIHFEMVMRTFDIPTNIAPILDYISDVHVFDDYLDLVLTVWSSYSAAKMAEKFPLSNSIMNCLKLKFA